MTSESTAKKDIQKLQRAIVEGLEDVKAQDIVVFNTEDLSPLFERVIVASGTSNRQTKALASSVRDAVREAGFDKPRVEGEENGEWIIVDCGQAVAHIMQPVIRQYYRLEDIWGTKPVRLKLGAQKAAEAKKAAEAAPARKTRATKAVKDVAQAVPARKVVARKATATASPVPTARKAAAPKKSAAATKVASPTGAKAKATLPKVLVNAPKPAAKKTAGAKSIAAKPVARKAPAKKPAAKKKA